MAGDFALRNATRSALAALVRRHALVAGAVGMFLLLCGVYAFSIDIRASRGASITGDEPFYLLTTQSLVRDGDLDLRNQYAQQSYREFFDHPNDLWMQSVPTADGRLLSPHDPGLSVLVIPGYLVGGLVGVQGQLLLMAALTFALAYVLVRRIVGRAIAAWLSTLAVAVAATPFIYATEVYPEVPAALALVAALLVVGAPHPMAPSSRAERGRGKAGWAIRELPLRVSDVVGNAYRVVLSGLAPSKLPRPDESTNRDLRQREKGLDWGQRNSPPREVATPRLADSSGLATTRKPDPHPLAASGQARALPHTGETDRRSLGPGWAVVLALLLTGMVWLGVKYAALAVPVAGYFLWRAQWHGKVTLVGLGALSAAGYVWFHLHTFGELTPYHVNAVYAGMSTAETVQAHVSVVDRAYRLYGLFIDERFGVGRWAPVLLAALPALPLLWRLGGVGRLVLGLVCAQVLVATFVAITMMGWWFPGRTLMTVLPLFALPLAVLGARAGWKARVALAGLAVYSGLVTLALAAAGRAREVTTAVDPFEMGSPVFRLTEALFPDFRAWTWETAALSAGWVAAWGVGVWMVGRKIGRECRAPSGSGIRVHDMR